MCYISIGSSLTDYTTSTTGTITPVLQYLATWKPINRQSHPTRNLDQAKMLPGTTESTTVLRAPLFPPIQWELEMNSYTNLGLRNLDFARNYFNTLWFLLNSRGQRHHHDKIVGQQLYCHNSKNIKFLLEQVYSKWKSLKISFICSFFILIKWKGGELDLPKQTNDEIMGLIYQVHL